MNTFVRAVVTGFAFTLGATLFRKFAKKVGLEEDASAKPAAAQANASASEPVTTA